MFFYLQRVLLHLDILKCAMSLALWLSSPDSSLGSVILPSRSSPLPIMVPGFHPWHCSHALSGHQFTFMVCYSYLSAAPILVLSTALMFLTACWVYEHMFGCNEFFKLNNCSLQRAFLSHHLPPSSLSSTHTSRLVVVPPGYHLLSQHPYVCSSIN